MKLKFENLGILKSGEIDLSKDLIILTGGNNTGKSYISYLLYGLYRLWDEQEKNKFHDYIISISDINKDYPEFIYTLNLKKDFKKINKELSISLVNSLNKSLHSLFASKLIKPIISLTDNTEFKDINSLNINEKNLEYSNGIITYKKFAIDSRINRNLTFNFSKKEYTEYLTHKLFNIVNFYGNQSTNLYNKFFPAERSSINLFSKDIIQNKARKLDEISLLSETDRNKIRLKTNFPLPISDYLYFINDLKDKDSYESDYGYIADELESLIGGSVTLNEFDEITFNPENSKKQLDLHISSSTVKSLAGIIFYFRYYAMKNDVIFIDEPELNLHPDNQIKLTRILAKIINSGIKMVISTHSDYIIKEFNNLIMLNNDKKGKLIKQLNYDQDCVINNNKIGAYYFSTGKDTILQKLDVSKTGINVESIDNTIDNQDYNGETIYYNLFEN